MRAEISQAKRRAEHFTEQVEKGARIKRLEEKVRFFWFLHSFVIQKFIYMNRYIKKIYNKKIKNEIPNIYRGVLRLTLECERQTYWANH